MLELVAQFWPLLALLALLILAGAAPGLLAKAGGGLLVAALLALLGSANKNGR